MLFNRFGGFAHSAWPELKHSKVTTELQGKSKRIKMVDLGTIFRHLGRLWGASGRPLGVSGTPPGGVFGALGGILVALAAKKPSRVPKDAPKSPQGHPKRKENETGAPYFGVSGSPKMTPNQ